MSNVIETDNLNTSRMFFALSTIPLLIALVCHQWDLQISDSVRTMKLPGDVRKAIQLCEAFAHAAGCAAILAALFWIDLRNRPMLVRTAVLTAICGIAANGAKYFVPRTRPHSFESSTAIDLSTWNTWGIPFTESWFNESVRSFPSGHTATAIGLAIGLSCVYPRGKWIFGAMAAGACFQRLISGAHYLTDIMASIAGAMIIAGLLLNTAWWKLAVHATNDEH